MTSELAPMTDLDRQARDWLVRVQLGDATGPGETAQGRMDALRQFEQWKSADPAHAAAAERMQRAMRASSILAGSEMLAESRAGVPRQSWLRRHTVLAGTIAAGLAAAAGLSIAYRGGLASPVSQGTGAPADLAYASAVGATRQLVLPDGSRILLDADSSLRVRFGTDQRWVRLDRGRARFTVVHDAALRFVVEAGDTRIIDHGTVFDVSVSGAGVHVALVRGSIEVTSRVKPPLGKAPSRSLSPGQQLTIDNPGSVPAPKPVASGELDWVSGRLSFDHTRLGDAVAEMNRYNARKLVLADRSLEDLRCSGGFEAQSPEKFAAAVTQALGLRVQMQSNGNILILASTALTSP